MMENGIAAAQIDVGRRFCAMGFSVGSSNSQKPKNSAMLPLTQ
jgi:hypothetical protein